MFKRYHFFIFLIFLSTNSIGVTDYLEPIEIVDSEYYQYIFIAMKFEHIDKIKVYQRVNHKKLRPLNPVLISATDGPFKLPDQFYLINPDKKTLYIQLPNIDSLGDDDYLVSANPDKSIPWEMTTRCNSPVPWN